MSSESYYGKALRERRKDIFATKLPGVTSLEPFYRYAFSQPITTAVIGCVAEDAPPSRLKWSEPILRVEIGRKRGCILKVSDYLSYGSTE